MTQSRFPATKTAQVRLPYRRTSAGWIACATPTRRGESRWRCLAARRWWRFVEWTGQRRSTNESTMAVKCRFTKAMRQIGFAASLAVAALHGGQPAGYPAGAPSAMELRAVGVPDGTASGPHGEIRLRIMAAFRERFPHVTLLPATGISIPGRSDTLPLMQIAGDVSPDVIYVNFRQSDTYVRNKLLYPLDRYLEQKAGVSLPEGHLLTTDADAAAVHPQVARTRWMRTRLAPELRRT